MTYRVSVYCTAVSRSWHDRVIGVCTSTMATCKQCSAGEVGRLSKHEIYGAFSERIHFYEFLYNTYISWPLFYAVKCSITSTERVSTGRVFTNRSLSGYTSDFSAYMYIEEKNQPSAFLFQTRESILTLRDKKQGMARPVPNLSHLFSHVNHTCFNPEIFTCDHARILTCKLG